MTSTGRIKVRIVSPCYNEEQVIRDFYVELKKVCDLCQDFEFEYAFVDDGSSDGTLRILNEMAAADSNISIYSFSRNFGHQAALLAGIDSTANDTDILIMMDSDLQHPPECIPEMLRAWADGFDIVSMVRRDETKLSFSKRLTARLYYRFLIAISDLGIVPGASDFCLLGRGALQAIRSMPEHDLFLRGAVSWIGYRRKLIEFDVAARRAGHSKYTIRKMFKLARQGIFTFSTAPIRFTFRVGVILTGIATLYLIYAMAVLATGGAVRGWASVIAVVMFFGGLQLFTLGVLGEYIARTFEEVKQRPRYLFKQAPRQAVSREILRTG
jgi:dolichol-phosphate mannosyltransferase